MCCQKDFEKILSVDVHITADSPGSSHAALRAKYSCNLCYLKTMCSSFFTFATQPFMQAHLPVLEEEVNDLIAPIVVIEEDVERPVHEPASLLQLLQNGGKGV